MFDSRMAGNFEEFCFVYIRRMNFAKAKAIIKLTRISNDRIANEVTLWGIHRHARADEV